LTRSPSSSDEPGRIEQCTAFASSSWYAAIAAISFSSA
jgi:hypothetical protein